MSLSEAGDGGDGGAGNAARERIGVRGRGLDRAGACSSTGRWKGCAIDALCAL